MSCPFDSLNFYYSIGWPRISCLAASEATTAAHVTRNDGSVDEDAALRAFDREGLSPGRWSNGPGDTYAAHSHAYHKVLYCIRGSITFRLPDTGEQIELYPGDRLDLEPGTAHTAIVGHSGVECVEAARVA